MTNIIILKNYNDIVWRLEVREENKGGKKGREEEEEEEGARHEKEGWDARGRRHDIAGEGMR